MNNFESLDVGHSHQKSLHVGKTDDQFRPEKFLVITSVNVLKTLNDHGNQVI
jgi:hypothetical protein